MIGEALGLDPTGQVILAVVLSWLLCTIPARLFFWRLEPTELRKRQARRTRQRVAVFALLWPVVGLALLLMLLWDVFADAFGGGGPDDR